LAPRALVAEPPDAHRPVLVERLDPLAGRDGRGVVAGGGGPDREEDDLLATRQLLNAEVTLAPPAGHEVRAAWRFLHGRLVVEGRPVRGRVGEGDGSAGDALELLVGPGRADAGQGDGREKGEQAVHSDTSSVACPRGDAPCRRTRVVYSDLAPSGKC